MKTNEKISRRDALKRMSKAAMSVAIVSMLPNVNVMASSTYSNYNDYSNYDDYKNYGDYSNYKNYENYTNYHNYNNYSDYNDCH